MSQAALPIGTCRLHTVRVAHVRPLIRQRHRDNIQVVVAEDLVRSHRMQLATSLPILAIRDEMPQFTVVSVHSVATVTPVIF